MKHFLKFSNYDAEFENFDFTRAIESILGQTETDSRCCWCDCVSINFSARAALNFFTPRRSFENQQNASLSLCTRSVTEVMKFP